MDRDGVTIVIPNWNHEVFLPRSIASGLAGVEAMRRSGVPSELVVVDDHSRDGSAPLLRQLEVIYRDRGLRVASHARNSGLAAARNRGLDEASYRYVVFMDADNELVPGNLGLLHRSLKETGAAAAFGNLLAREQNARRAGWMISNAGIHPKIFSGNYVDAFSMVDRVQVHDSGRYDASCSAHEDYELWLHLATTGRRILFVPVVFGYYYIVPNSMIKDTDQNHRINGRIRRIFDQVGARPMLPLETNCLRYHPDLGYH
ncbi:glycosyltransferase family 2 protein [Tautonia plasticadhaerens]|uniref:GalNAc(5)-diNAcBac-PP-undecaprenol beta-1,3-glucosyltransferase n=1 Tax=Tautonia plasticadhaerens TaxID=2527974 RepID=A0A518HFK2_9BACT|nr:glycosyltransferase family 2 protein [Tautonia plasticadhaerens]QDV39608.1 GalNAc(5)-diNAcBac-PP-undecaprenol beta-1,3-glucosyltransferase [Tautonia plasticadhaerens]